MANNPPPYTQDLTNTPDFASISSVMQSLKSQGGTTQTSAASSSVDSSAPPATASSTIESVASTSNSPSPTTFSTATTSSDSSAASSITSTAGNTSSSGSGSSQSTGVVTNSSATAAGSSGSETGSVTSETECSSVSCSPGLKAAVAVPVVVGTLAILGLILFFVRRRRRGRSSASPVLESSTPKKKWTRHLRIFSFDTELLMGGRFSSTNSLRSGPSSHRDIRSVNHAHHAHHTDHPSIHSIEEVAPPYRDAISHAHQPNMSQVAAGAAGAGLLTGMAQRPSSRTSAPPPYGSAASNRSNRSNSNPATPLDTQRDPFADSNPVSPVDGVEWSPFNDPPEDGSSTHSQPSVSRNSSIRTANDRDGVSNFAASDAGSIREAQVGRHVSIASGGRTITDVRTSSQSPTHSATIIDNSN